MKNLTLFTCVLGFVCLLTRLSEGQVHSTALDKVNVDAYLRNPKLIQYHINCLVYNGPCDKVGQEIKRLLPLVGRQCRGCSEEQRRKLGRILAHLQQNYPQAWQDMMRKLREF